MAKLLRLKAIINKRNGQLNLSFPKKQMPKDMKDMLKSNPSQVKLLRLKFEGFE